MKMNVKLYKANTRAKYESHRDEDIKVDVQTYTDG